jgi:hypothetical protein
MVLQNRGKGSKSGKRESGKAETNKTGSLTTKYTKYAKGGKDFLTADECRWGGEVVGKA